MSYLMLQVKQSLIKINNFTLLWKKYRSASLETNIPDICNGKVVSIALERIL